jgi:hypothetical protein
MGHLLGDQETGVILVAYAEEGFVRLLHNTAKERYQRKGDPAAPPLRGSFGLPAKLGGCATRPSNLHKTQAAAELEQCSPSSQFGWQTEAAQKGFPEHEVTRLRVFDLFWSVRAMPGQKKKLPRAVRVTARSLESLLRRFGLADKAGALGEHCSSSAADRVLCGLSGRVAQPPLYQPIRRNPEGAARQGALLFGTFILGKQNKDTSCRAAPDKSINCAWNAHHTLRI